MAPFFYSPQIPQTSLIELDADTSHHIAQVLRMRVGEMMHLTDGAGTRVTGHLAAISKKQCSLTVSDRVFQDRTGPSVRLAIAPVKNSGRFEWLIEKAVELGVRQIVIMRTRRTEKQHLRIDRIHQIAVAAMLQSQQVWLPDLEWPVEYEDLIGSWGAMNMQRLIAHCLDTDRKHISQLAPSDEVGILIGPEGDFTEQEIRIALDADFHAVQLGETRLRTETAGVVAASWLRLR